MSDVELEKIEPQEIWVDVFEAADFTGYSLGALRKVIERMNRKPEEEREIRMRKRTSRWELWLPDLIGYTNHPNHGPNSRSKKET